MRLSGRQIALLPEDEAEEIVGLGMRRVAANRLGGLIAGGAQLAAGRRFPAARIQIVGRTGRRWPGPELECDRALLLQRDTERIVGVAPLRVDFQRPLDRGYGAGQIVVLPERLSELVVNSGILWIPGGDPSQVHERAAEVSRVPEREAEIQVSGKAVGLERQRLAEDGHGLDEIAFRGQRRAEICVGARVAGVQGDRSGQHRDGAGKIRLIRERHTEPVVRFR